MLYMWNFSRVFILMPFLVTHTSRSYDQNFLKKLSIQTTIKKIIKISFKAASLIEGTKF